MKQIQTYYKELWLHQGANFLIEFQCKTHLGEIVDLTGCNGHAQIRKSPSSLSFVPFRVDIFKPEDGWVRISMDAETTSNIRYGHYQYDVEISMNSSEYDDSDNYNGNHYVQRVMQGNIVVDPQITR